MTRKTYRSVSAIALAAMLAGGATVLPNFSGEVIASAPIHSGKGDRLDIRATECSEQAWPYFETNCLRDKRVALGKVVQAARIVTADRISIAR
jgi:hypothetical protein